jgi:hypothetical protein
MRAMRALAVPVLCLAVLSSLSGCASSGTSASGAPTVTISQTSAVDPFQAAQSTGVPVEFRLDVVNPLDVPVTLTAVELETVGASGGYQLKRVRHPFTEVVAAKSSSSIALRAWVQPLQVSETGRVSTPVILRGSAMFDSPSGSLKSNFAATLKAVGPSR